MLSGRGLCVGLISRLGGVIPIVICLSVNAETQQLGMLCHEKTKILSLKEAHDDYVMML